jgi:CHAT domain-containing protein/Tfp pilus assembly protein PilF
LYRVSTPLARFILILGMLLTAPLCQATAGGPTLPVEPPAPLPSPAVLVHLSWAAQRLQVGEPAQSLEAADQAVAAARSIDDHAGEALAQRHRAMLLYPMGRPVDAVAAWQAAAAVWDRAGYGPGRVEALAAAALVSMFDDRASEGKLLVQQACSVALKETARPLTSLAFLEGAAHLAHWEGYRRVQGSAASPADAVPAARRDTPGLAGMAPQTAPGPSGATGGRSLLQAAREWALCMVRMYDTHLPGTGWAADARLFAGDVEYALGELSGAQEQFQKVLSQVETALGKGAPQTLSCLDRLGSVTLARGDLAAADRYVARAVRIREAITASEEEQVVSLCTLASIKLTRGDLDTAKRHLDRALVLAKKGGPDGAGVMFCETGLGDLAAARRDVDAARKHFEAALSIQDRLQDKLGASTTQVKLGLLEERFGDLSAAESYYQKALGTQLELVPGSLLTAGTLTSLANLATTRGDFTLARDRYQRALAIQRTAVPDSPAVASTLTFLGQLALRTEDLSTAEAKFQEALRLRKKLTPGSLPVAASLSNLAMVANARDEVSRAAEYLRQAFSIVELVDPNSPEAAVVWIGLGGVAYSRGDVEAAREHLRRAQTLIDRCLPDSRNTVQTATAAGMQALSQGDPASAEAFLRQALALQAKLPPVDMTETPSLHRYLAGALLAQGKSAEAVEQLQQTVAVLEKTMPGSLALARALTSMAQARVMRQEYPEARAALEQSLPILQDRAPGFLDEALARAGLGRLSARAGDMAAAERQLSAAWEIVRRQAPGAIGDEARQAYQQMVLNFAGDLAAVQTARGDYVVAVRTVEQGRSQALLQLMQERGVGARLVDPARYQAWRKALSMQNNAEGALAQAEATVAQSDPSGITEERERARAALAKAREAFVEARVRQEQAWAAVRQSAPAIQEKPITVDEIRATLAPGDLVLLFAIGWNSSALFLLRSGGAPEALRAVPIKVPVLELVKQVDALRLATDTKSASPAEALQPGRALYQTLIPPEARDAVQKAHRLIISPEGLLWRVPWAALVMNSESDPAYLGLTKPLTLTPSLAIYARTQREPRALKPGSRPKALVVGACLYTAKAVTTAARKANRSAAGLVSLPAELASLQHLFGEPVRLEASGEEARAIAREYGTVALTDLSTTETAIRRRSTAADVIHLSTHGRFHYQRPMSSGILLTPPVKPSAANPTDDDGILQAWELFWGVRLRAELVVISACQSGGGTIRPGEGVIGLTRALQYAGARSIVASQWPVAERSTAALMVAFHHNLREGEDKAEALRLAMRGIANKHDPTEDCRSPFYWAAFFLVGDPDNRNLSREKRLLPLNRAGLGRSPGAS